MKYRPVTYYLDKAKEKLGVENDTQLALEHKINPSKIHHWRSGRNLPSQEIARELARWGGIAEEEAMIEREIWLAEKHGDEEGVKKWVEILKTVTRSMANSLYIAATCMVPFAFSPMFSQDLK